MRLRVLPLLVTATAAVVAAGAVPALAAPGGPPATATDAAPVSPDSAIGTYFPDTPRRIFDTRAAGNSRLGQGRTVVIAPYLSGVTPTAVVLNLTVVNPTTTGYLTAYPTGRALPRTSSINFGAGATRANLVTVPVGSDGRIAIYNGLGTTDVIVDQVGIYSKNDDAVTNGRGRGGGYHPSEVQRFVDTRSDGGGQLPSFTYFTLPVSFGDGTGPNPIASLAVNVTVTNTRGSGYVTTWDGSSNTPPRTSTLNFSRGTTVANSAIVPVSPCPDCSDNSVQIGIANGSGAGIDVIVDVTGYFDDGSVAAPVRYVPLASPIRIVDSRTGTGVTKLGAGATRTFTPPTSVAGEPTVGLDANVTLVKPTASTYLTLWPQLTNYPKPRASTVNSGAGQVISNHALQEVGTDNEVNVFNFAGTTDVVVDVSGTFEYIAADGTDRRTASGQLHVGRPSPARAAVVTG